MTSASTLGHPNYKLPFYLFANGKELIQVSYCNPMEDRMGQQGTRTSNQPQCSKDHLRLLLKTVTTSSVLAKATEKIAVSSFSHHLRP